MNLLYSILPVYAIMSSAKDDEPFLVLLKLSAVCFGCKRYNIREGISLYGNYSID